MKKITLVTDRAAKIPEILGASVSEHVSLLNKRWVWCFVHRLNNVMKHVLVHVQTEASNYVPLSSLTTCQQSPLTANNIFTIDADLEANQHNSTMQWIPPSNQPDITKNDKEENRIFKHIIDDLSSIKSIIPFFKQIGGNEFMASGVSLAQEVETRFGTTWETVRKFWNSIPFIRGFWRAKTQPILNSLHCEITSDGKESWPSLNSLFECFEPICHVQLKLEMTKTLTMHLVLLLLEKLKKDLQGICFNIQVMQRRKYHLFTTKLAKSPLQY